MNTLEETREIDGAKLDPDEGRYYVEREGKRQYGYRTHFAGMWVCYTDGHLCECGEEE
jgi:hypothetical protein